MARSSGVGPGCVSGGCVCGACVWGGVGVGVCPEGWSLPPSDPAGRVNDSPVVGSTSVKTSMITVVCWMIVMLPGLKPAHCGPRYLGLEYVVGGVRGLPQ